MELGLPGSRRSPVPDGSAWHVFTGTLKQSHLLYKDTEGESFLRKNVRNFHFRALILSEGVGEMTEGC